MKVSSTYNSIRPTWCAIMAMPVIGVDCIAIPAGIYYPRGGNRVGCVGDLQEISG